MSLRGQKRARGRPILDTWFYPLHVGEPLPVLPVSLDVDLGVSLDLEKRYEETCRVLRIV